MSATVITLIWHILRSRQGIPAAQCLTLPGITTLACIQDMLTKGVMCSCHRMSQNSKAAMTDMLAFPLPKILLRKFLQKIRTFSAVDARQLIKYLHFCSAPHLQIYQTRVWCRNICRYARSTSWLKIWGTIQIKAIQSRKRYLHFTKVSNLFRNRTWVLLF